VARQLATRFPQNAHYRALLALARGHEAALAKDRSAPARSGAARSRSIPSSRPRRRRCIAGRRASSSSVCSSADASRAPRRRRVRGGHPATGPPRPGLLRRRRLRRAVALGVAPGRGPRPGVGRAPRAGRRDLQRTDAAPARHRRATPARRRRRRRPRAARGRSSSTSWPSIRRSSCWPAACRRWRAAEPALRGLIDGGAVDPASPIARCGRWSTLDRGHARHRRPRDLRPLRRARRAPPRPHARSATRRGRSR
jgi:hypothetical protein